MALTPASFLCVGGLDLVTPAMALPQGRAIAALNYEPEARGYRRLGGYERFDGRASPSGAPTPSAAVARRAAIGPVPGVGPVRGVHIYQQAVYAFRDDGQGGAQMYRATNAGWLKLTFGQVLNFTNGTEELSEGVIATGDSSGATITIRRVVLQSGAWDGTGAGYIVFDAVNGTIADESITDANGGKAKVGISSPIRLAAGGEYDFAIHNFYGSTKSPRLYFASGVDTAFEFDGTTLSPIRTGTTAGNLANIIPILTRDGSNFKARNGDDIVMRGNDDSPTRLGVHSDHLFLAFPAGSLLHSGIGEPLDFRVIAGAGEISFGGAPTGILSSVSTSMVIFGQSRVEYLVGTDSDNFEIKPISDEAGAAISTMQLAGEAPVYLDEGGLRRLSTTSAFGAWRMGSLSQAVEPLFRAKRDAGIPATASLIVKGKDQYRLFFADGSGVVMYLGRDTPEILPIRLRATVFSSCSDEMQAGEGERLFVGATDGYVYELDKGPSFDGESVPAYLRFGWNNQKAPTIEKRFHSAFIQTDSQTPMTVGLAYEVDYNASENLDGELRLYQVAAGSSEWFPVGDAYQNVDWSLAAAGEIRADDLCGLGRNIALTIINEHTLEAPHILTAMTLNYSARRQLR